MLPKKARLDRVRFTQVSKNARQIACRYFVCKYCPSGTVETRYIASLQHNRFAVVVSQNVCKKAVDRNYKRRQTYEAIQKNLPFLKKNLLMILFAKKSLAQAEFREIDQDIEATFQQLSR